jgi:benzoyl-CoA-dihydrodiol lyase
VILEYEHVTLVCDRAKRLATLTVHAPEGPQPESVGAIHEAGAAFWALAAFRELDDALCRLRLDEEEIGLVLLKTAPARLAAGPGASPPASGRLSRGSGAAPAADSALDAGFEAAEAACSSLLKLDQVLAANRSDWLVNEIVLHMARVLRRLDLTAKSLFAVVEPGSCFAGPLLELALAADRIYMKNDATSPAFLRIGSLSGGHLPMPHGLTRLQSRLLADPARAEALSNDRTRFDAPAALAAGLVTVAPDELDWDDELRLAVEERLSLSPDALTGMEASLRFGGPETADSKIYGRLSAWQNWIFIRPNATGEHGALKLYGQPERPKFDWRRT